jgi:hypothetical protein
MPNAHVRARTRMHECTRMSLVTHHELALFHVTHACIHGRGYVGQMLTLLVHPGTILYALECAIMRSVLALSVSVCCVVANASLEEGCMQVAQARASE